MNKLSIAIATALCGLAALTASATTYTVTNTGDSGAGSLRQAITDANAHPGADTIAFDVPGAGVHTIAPLTALPPITDTVTIDGYTQPGASANTNAFGQPSNAVILIELDGENLPASTSGIEIQADSVVVRGLAVNRCLSTQGFPPFYGAIVITSGSNTVVAGNVIGLDPSGTVIPNVAGARQKNGVVLVTSGNGHTIGGPNPADRNVISGNWDPNFGGSGIRTNGSGTLTIQGNYIGVDASGSLAAPDGLGIWCSDSAALTLGGPAAGQGNLIGGSVATGVILSGCSDATIQGNFIGTDAAGTARLANVQGIYLNGSFNVTLGGLAAGESNTIAYNGAPDGLSAGVTLGSARARIRGNRFVENAALGIDIMVNGVPGPTPDDSPDVDGAQNFPVITSVDYGASTTVHASFTSAPSTTYDVDFYSAPVCASKPALPTQGQDFAGTTPVTTDGSGNATIDFTLPVVLAAGQPVVAVAISPTGATSEFSTGLVARTSVRSGPAAGGASGVLFGQLFDPNATVTFGGVPATGVTVTTPGVIHATAPALPAGSVNDIVVTNPGGVSGRLRNGYVANFNDVPANDLFHSYVVSLVANQITAGVGGGNYGISDSIKRQSMAVFILKAKHGVCYVPPPCTGMFADVPCSSNFAPWIEAMATEGITGGCGGGNFCPLAPVRRDQMAVFLLKGEHGSSYVPPPCAGVFNDVACPSTFANWIEQLKAEDITGGCGDGTTYCPSSSNTRGQMAVFMVKAFRLL
ncbi:MAG TPA: S-layer homology domain-containing protein [Thermoanaerobaculia bacterium]|nr:S-layer homology domain-containing protein [Thermoanaerobaculia bacterium]